MPGKTTRTPTPVARFLDDRGINRADAAEALGLSRGSLNMLVGGHVLAWAKVRRRFVEVYGADPFPAAAGEVAREALAAIAADDIGRAAAVLFPLAGEIAP
jgi:hypothetical protein